MSILTETPTEQRAAIAERNRHESYGTDLLKLYNKELVEYVRQQKDGTYVPCWPNEATHELIPTSWNHRKDYKPNKSGKVVMPEGYALSVCAVPMSRKFVLRGRMIKASRPLPPPKERLAYHASGELDGRRNVLIWMVEVMGAKVKRTDIREADGDKLNNIYRNLLMAHAGLV